MNTENTQRTADEKCVTKEHSAVDESMELAALVDSAIREWLPLAGRYSTLTDLALAYHPTVSPRSARRFLTKILRSMPSLMDDLHRVGFTFSQRIIFPSQTLVIFRWLGPPREGGH